MCIMEAYLMNYAKAIKELRHKMLVTQTELGEILGTTFGTVNRWEKGTYEPTMVTKRKLAELFGKYHIEIDNN